MMKKMKNGEKVIEMQKVATSRDCKRLQCHMTIGAVSMLRPELVTMRRDVQS